MNDADENDDDGLSVWSGVFIVGEMGLEAKPLFAFVIQFPRFSVKAAFVVRRHVCLLSLPLPLFSFQFLFSFLFIGSPLILFFLPH